MKLTAQALVFVLCSSSCFSQLTPDPPIDCGLSISLKAVGQIQAGNLNAPVPVGKDLYLIDQALGKIYVDEKAKGSPELIFDISAAPDGLTFGFPDTLTEYISNVSPGPSEDELYVGFQSSSLPADVTPYGSGELPDEIVESHSGGYDGTQGASAAVDLYRLGPMEPCYSYCCLCSGIFPDTQTIYHVIYKYSIEGGSLTNPVPLTAFATQSGPTHKGGGMATLPDGRLLFATGDALPFGTNGREGAQDDTTSVSKLFAISPSGEVELLAKGLRQPQRLEFVDTGGNGPTLLAIGEIGGVTSEEINIAPLDELLDTSFIENFGWGIATDGQGREGTFYTGPGVAGIFGTQPPAIGVAPVPEAGYIQPHAQYGRFDPSAFIAIAGPVTSRPSFELIKTLFVDLPSGQFLATTISENGPATYGTNEPVCKVQIMDKNGVFFETANKYFQSENRLDPRPFRFPSGKAGVLFERTGEYYIIEEIQ